MLINQVQISFVAETNNKASFLTPVGGEVLKAVIA